MGESLSKNFINQNEVDLQKLFFHEGIDGILSKFEAWLLFNKYIVKNNTTYFIRFIEKSISSEVENETGKFEQAVYIDSADNWKWKKVKGVKKDVTKEEFDIWLKARGYTVTKGLSKEGLKDDTDD